MSQPSLESAPAKPAASVPSPAAEPWRWWEDRVPVRVTRAPLEPRLAIVIPCYNVERYVGAALGSVAAQPEFAGAEVICVDDGSTDGTGAILDDFARPHPNVTVVHQANRGLGRARNAGLERVTAPYVTFLDSDDLLGEGALGALLDAAESTGAEVVIGDLTTFPSERPYGPWKRHFGHGDRLLTHLAEAEDLVFFCGATGRIFATRLLRAQKLRFGVDVLFEDAWLTVPAMLAARRIALVDRTVLYYRGREDGGSIMDSLWRRRRDYWDHLRLNRRLLGLARLGDAAGLRLVQRFCARTYQGFLSRAGGTLEGVELYRLFGAVREMYELLPEEVTAEYALRADQRLSLLGVRIGDQTLFAHPVPATANRPVIHLDAEGPFRLECDDEGNARRVRLGEPVAAITGWESAGRDLTGRDSAGVRGTLAVPGWVQATVERPPIRVELVRLGAHGETVAQGSVAAGPDATLLSWSCPLPPPPPRGRLCSWLRGTWLRERLLLRLRDHDRHLEVPLALTARDRLRLTPSRRN